MAFLKKTLKQEKARTSVQGVWKSWIKPLLVVFLMLGTFRSAVADWSDVPTGSMKPTILEGDRIFVNKLAYDLKVPFVNRPLIRWAGPSRGDVIVFRSPSDDTLFVKRVVGVPGDRLELRHNHLFVNGALAEYRPLDPAIVQQLATPERSRHRLAQETVDGRSHPIMTTPAQHGPDWFGPIIVPRGNYFVLGDNRDDSFDSRFFGFVERDRILGHATAVVLSLDHENYLLPRWRRFFHGLP